MERGPLDNSGFKFTRRIILISIVFVLLISLIFYLVYQRLGQFYAWAILFLIVINIYLTYRTTIRRNLAGKLFEDKNNSELFNNSPNSKNKEPTPHEILHPKYEHCGNCNAELIPNLEYCESCGDKV